MAVYTQLSIKQLQPILNNYDIGEALQLKGIAEGTVNSNYHLKTTTDNFICTIVEAPEEVTQIEWLPKYLNHLAKQNVPVMTFVADKKGSYSHHINSKQLLISSLVKGEEKPISTHTAKLAGETLAMMHKASKGYEHKGLQTWAPSHLKKVIANLNEANYDDEKKKLLEILKQEACWQTDDTAARLDLPSGVIHADLFSDNILFDGDKVGGVIDFYMAGIDCFAYDLATALTAWGFDGNGDFVAPHFKAFYDGYNNVRQLSKAEYVALPELCRRASCVVLAMRLNTWIKPVISGKPPRPPEAYAKRLLFFKTNKLEDILNK